MAGPHPVEPVDPHPLPALVPHAVPPAQHPSHPFGQQEHWPPLVPQQGQVEQHEQQELPRAFPAALHPVPHAEPAGPGPDITADNAIMIIGLNMEKLLQTNRANIRRDAYQPRRFTPR